MTEKDSKILLRMLKEIKLELSELRDRLDNNPKLNTPEKFLTRKQAEEYLQVSERKLFLMLSSGQLPFATKVGGQWRIPQSELERTVART